MPGLDKIHQYDLIILDFSKVFDRVPNKRLLKKMDHYGVRGSTYKWFQAFPTDRAQQKQVESATSNCITVISGVPQGTVFGPSLCLLFINDIPDCVQSSTRLFADDFILYRRIRKDKDAEILQEELIQLAEWEKRWGMAFFVRPVQEYCSSVWSPYTQDTINKLEMVQRQAA